jgi:hypothetical protein
VAEIRPYDEVQAEIVAACQSAVDKAIATESGQQAQAVAWFDGYLDGEGLVVSPGPADPPADN